MVHWTDYNKVLAEWNALMDEEDIPKWDIYNDKVATFKSITANLSNHHLVLQASGMNPHR